MEMQFLLLWVEELMGRWKQWKKEDNCQAGPETVTGELQEMAVACVAEGHNHIFGGQQPKLGKVPSMEHPWVRNVLLA